MSGAYDCASFHLIPTSGMIPSLRQYRRTLSKHKTVVQILNATQDGPRYTSVRRARLYVSLDRAEWVGKAIRFLDNYKRLNLLLLTENKIRLRTQDQAGYDGVGMMTIDQAQGLPCAGPAARLFTKGGRLALKHDNCRTISKINLK